jgi:hypothetical protein
VIVHSAPKTDNYSFYLANIIRALIANNTPDHADISGTAGWQQRGIPVGADYVPEEVMVPPPEQASAAIDARVAARRGPPPEQVAQWRQLRGAIADRQAPDETNREVQQAAVGAGIRGINAGTTNGQIVQAITELIGA